MGPQAEDYIETVLTCEGDFYDPEFHTHLSAFSEKLEQILIEDKKKNPLILKKVEPWNSVKVTFNIPKEAAVRLKCLAEEGNKKLRELGILAVQIEGDRTISLRIAGKNNETTELVFKTTDVSVPSASAFEVEKTRDASKNENTRKSFAQYLSQHQEQQGSSNASVIDIISRTFSNASPTTIISGVPTQNVPAPRQPLHGFGSDLHPALQGPPQISPKFPTPPPSVSMPNSPGSKTVPNFVPQLSHSNLLENQAAVNNMVSRLFGSKNNSATSPLLVNLLQNDPLAAAAHAAAVASGTIDMLGLPTQDGVPPQKKRKRRKPKDKEGKEVNKKIAKTEKETESAIHSILNQAAAEKNVQNRVPPVGNESNISSSRPTTPAQISSPPFQQSRTPSKSPILHARSPRHLDIGARQRQIINPSTGQLEFIEEESVYASPPGKDIGVHHKSSIKPVHSPHQSTSLALHQNTQAGMQVPGSVYHSTSPVTASSGKSPTNINRDLFAFSDKLSGYEHTDIKLSSQGRKGSGGTGISNPSFQLHQPHSVRIPEPQKLNQTKSSSLEANAQSNSAIMPVVSNIANSAPSTIQVSVSMQNQHIAHAQFGGASQNQNKTQSTVKISPSRTVPTEVSIPQSLQTSEAKNVHHLNAEIVKEGALASLASVPLSSSENMVTVQSVISTSSSLAPRAPFLPVSDKTHSHITSQGLHGTQSASNVPSQNISASISKNYSVSVNCTESNHTTHLGNNLQNNSFDITDRVKPLPMENHVNDEDSVKGKRDISEIVVNERTNLKLDRNTGSLDLQNHCSETIIRRDGTIQHHSELSNNSCDDHTKHGSVDSGLGDIKENNGESPCGSSGNDSPGAAVSRTLSVNSSPPTTKFLKMGEKNVLTVGYVLSNENAPQKETFTNKTGLHQACDAMNTVMTSKGSLHITPKLMNDHDLLPDLVKFGASSLPVLGVKQSVRGSMQLDHEHLNKSLNLIGRSDLNPGGQEIANQLSQVNGDDPELRSQEQSSRVLLARKKSSSPVEPSRKKSCSYSAKINNKAGSSQLSQATNSLGISTVPDQIHPMVYESNPITTVDFERDQLPALKSSKDTVITCPSFSESRTVTRDTPDNQNELNTALVSRTSPSLLNNSPANIAMDNGSHIVSNAESGGQMTAKSTSKIPVSLNPLLLHGHVMGRSTGLTMDSRNLKSTAGLPQTNGPLTLSTLSSNVSLAADSTTNVMRRPFLSIPNTITNCNTSNSTSDLKLKPDRASVVKQRSKTPDALMQRIISEVTRNVPSFVQPSSLTTVAPSIGQIPSVLSQLKTSSSPSKINTGMANLGPSPIMSTGLPSLGPSPIMSTGLTYLSSQTSRQVTPPPDSLKGTSIRGISKTPPPDGLKSVTTKGIPNVKTMTENESVEEETLGPSSEALGKKSPKKIEKPDKAAANKRAHFTVAQLLQDAEQKVKGSILKQSIGGDGTENLNKIPSMGKSATIALQQFAKNHDPSEVSEKTKFLSSSVSQISKSVSGKDDITLSASDVHVPNAFQKPASSSFRINAVHGSPQSNLTITAPGFHRNLTESVQKVMNVLTPDIGPKDQPSPNLAVVREKSPVAAELRKSPISKAMPKVNCTIGQLSKSGTDNLLIASAEAKQSIHDATKDRKPVSSTQSAGESSFRKIENIPQVSLTISVSTASVNNREDPETKPDASPASQKQSNVANKEPKLSASSKEGTLSEHSYSVSQEANLKVFNVKESKSQSLNDVSVKPVLTSTKNLAEPLPQAECSQESKPVPLTPSDSVPVSSDLSLVSKPPSSTASVSTGICSKSLMGPVGSSEPSLEMEQKHKVSLSSGTRDKSLVSPVLEKDKKEKVLTLEKDKKPVVHSTSKVYGQSSAKLESEKKEKAPPQQTGSEEKMKLSTAESVKAGKQSLSIEKEKRSSAIQLSTTTTRDSVVKVEEKVAGKIGVNASTKTEENPSKNPIEKSETKLSTKISHFSAVTTTVSAKETSKTIVISSKGGETNETTNFSLDLRSAVTASSSSKFMKIEPGSSKEWRLGHASKLTSALTTAKKNDLKVPEIKAADKELQEKPAATTVTRRLSATQNESDDGSKHPPSKSDTEHLNESHDTGKELVAQKLRRTSTRQSTDAQIQDPVDVPRASRIKRRASRGSNDSKTSSTDGARSEDCSPTLKMNTRGRCKTASESSENPDVSVTGIQSRRGSNASSRDRSTSPSPHNTRSSRQARKKPSEAAAEIVTDYKSTTPTSVPVAENNSARATRSSKRKLPVTEDKDSAGSDTKKTKIEPTLDSSETAKNDHLLKKTTTRGDSAEPESKSKVPPKSKAAKGKTGQAIVEIAQPVENPNLEEKNADGVGSKRSTRSTRSQDHCELPTLYAKKKQKT